MVYVPSNIKAFAGSRETSDEVALAIFELAPEGLEAAIWEDPGEAYYKAICARAFELADPECDELQWGVTTIRRNEEG